MIVDTNVLLDLIDGNDDSTFSQNMLNLMAGNTLCINEVVFAEVSGRYRSAAEVLVLLESLSIRLRKLTIEDCHRAGVAFLNYRREGRERTSILPDFLIGAQAEIGGWPLLTRDRKGFAKYFPGVALIDPYKVQDD